MTESGTDYTEAHIRHLEMIQSVISRMANNSNTIRRYAVVITAAAISFAKFADEPLVMFMTALLILVLATLDVSYVRLERCFRDLFNAVRAEDGRATRLPDFRLTPDRSSRSLRDAAKSTPIRLLYGALVGFQIVAALYLIWC